ncbi:MAG: hypothetical protein ACXWIM_18860 [Burkholderiales bacterium]
MTLDIAKESPQVKTTRVIAVGGVTLLVLVAIAFGFELVFKERIGQTYSVQHDFPLPGVVPNEGALRRALEAKQRAALAGEGGRIPIEKAMDDIVARGARAFDPIEGRSP